MASTMYFHTRNEGINKTTFSLRMDKDSKGKKYGELHLNQEGIEICIFLDKETTRRLLNVVRRIDRRLNQCQPKR